MEYLKRFYDRRSVVERYLKEDISIHVHGIATWIDSDVKECCLTFNTWVDDDWPLGGRLNGKNFRESYDGQRSMLVWVGNVPERARPITTIVRLQKLYTCLVSERKALKARLPVGSPKGSIAPTLFATFDRKLCLLLNLAGIEDGKFIDKIIKGAAKVVYGLADEDAESWRDKPSAQIDDYGASDLWVYVPHRWSEGTPENRGFSFEPRQVLFCPTYSRVGIIKGWLQHLGLEYELASLSRQGSNVP